MSKRISAVAVGLLIVLSPWLGMRAQGTAQLRIRVTVVPAVSAGVVQDTRATADVSQDAQFSWTSKQQTRVITRTANTTDLGNTWLNSQNPCASEGTKVLSAPLKPASCDITINTLEFIPE
jgi:hypothetical protein